MEHNTHHFTSPFQKSKYIVHLNKYGFINNQGINEYLQLLNDLNESKKKILNSEIRIKIYVDLYAWHKTTNHVT